VTAAQYTAFLNAVAKTDPYGLYNTNMDTAVFSWGCNITRTGSSGSYTYSVAPDWANRPVNFVSWGGAARFANWLTNGQPTGHQDLTTTEDGSYYLNGAMGTETLQAVKRIADASRAQWKKYYFIPTEDEWYKAAYHKNDGVTGHYFDYPTGSDGLPSNVLGNPTDPGNNATFYSNGWTLGSPSYRTEVGDHENSDSPYGTFDQGGNVWEWNEAIAFYGSFRGLRGGSFYVNDDDFVHAAFRFSHDPTLEIGSFGFRVSEVPEPATLALLAAGAVALVARRRRG
jgi:formylglycine-generating enzyme required for sulfatase activity